MNRIVPLSGFWSNDLSLHSLKLIIFTLFLNTSEQFILSNSSFMSFTQNNESVFIELYTIFGKSVILHTNYAIPQPQHFNFPSNDWWDPSHVPLNAMFWGKFVNSQKQRIAVQWTLFMRKAVRRNGKTRSVLVLRPFYNRMT